MQQVRASIFVVCCWVCDSFISLRVLKDVGGEIHRESCLCYPGRPDGVKASLQRQGLVLKLNLILHPPRGEIKMFRNHMDENQG